MKAIAYAAAVLGLVSVALGQAEDPGPSPTESVGCEPHGDHWHCEGPRVTSDVMGAATSNTNIALTTTTTTTAAHHHDEDDHDHDHDDDHHTDVSGTGALAPSPTESYGCEPHGDHWHCEGPVTANVTHIQFGHIPCLANVNHTMKTTKSTIKTTSIPGSQS